MNFYKTRYNAKKANPNAKISRLIAGINKGMFTAFYDWITIDQYKKAGLIR